MMGYSSPHRQMTEEMFWQLISDATGVAKGNGDYLQVEQLLGQVALENILDFSAGRGIERLNSFTRKNLFRLPAGSDWVNAFC